ncbi:MAG: hypothetical protein ACI4E5_01325 [Suilimivivens sp.]|nr:hypothetical protein [Lachnospiraceae bacterium]
MDFNHYNNPYNQNNNIYPEGQRQFIRNPGQTLATVSLALGIASIFTMLTVYIPLICGSLAIVLALLSKGYGKKMLIAAKIGVGTAIGGMALVITITGSLLALLLSSDGSTLVEFGKQLDQQFEQQTGQDLESLLGTSYEDIMQEYAESLGK